MGGNGSERSGTRTLIEKSLRLHIEIQVKVAEFFRLAFDKQDALLERRARFRDLDCKFRSLIAAKVPTKHVSKGRNGKSEEIADETQAPLKPGTIPTRERIGRKGAERR